MYFSLLFACQPDVINIEDAKAAITKEFTEKNNTEGRVAWQLKGKSAWFDGTGFNRLCLDENKIAFHHHTKKAMIQPELSSQIYFTDSTNKGYCLDMGEGLSIVTDEVTIDDASINTGSYRAKVHVEMKDPTPWFSCLSESFLQREIYVTYANKAVSVDDSAPLVFRDGEECSQPGKMFSKRPSPTSRPTEKPPKPPTMKEVVAILEGFDQALYDYDYHKALSYVSCASVFDGKWGTCTIAELLPHGAVTKGNDRMRDGAPWLANAIREFSNFRSIERDKKDPTLYHVRFNDRRSKKSMSISVQYSEGKWLLFGAVNEMQQGITPLSFILNLHDKETREIFTRRLAGEKIDTKGRPLNPFEKNEEEKK